MMISLGEFPFLRQNEETVQLCLETFIKKCTFHFNVIFSSAVKFLQQEINDGKSETFLFYEELQELMKQESIKQELNFV
jgi:hypothetical protein